MSLPPPEQIDPEASVAHDMQALSAAMAIRFSSPVTGYLTQTQISVNHGYGFVYKHVMSDPSANCFMDGNLIHTSQIKWVRREHGFWVLRTFNSFYVIASFHKYGGFDSLVDHLSTRAWIRRIAPITRQ